MGRAARISTQGISAPMASEAVPKIPTSWQRWPGDMASDCCGAGRRCPYADRDPTPEHAAGLCQFFIDKSVSGVFFAPLEYTSGGDAANHELLLRLGQAGIPVVLLDRDVAKFPWEGATGTWCRLDNFRAGFVLAEHVIRLGSTHLRFVARPESAPTVDARISGARRSDHPRRP